MRRVARLFGWIAAGALACAAGSFGQTPAATFAPLAHSAQLSAEEGACAGDTLIVRVRRSAGAAPLAGAQLSVSVDGRSLPVTALADGTFVVAAERPAGALTREARSHRGARRRAGAAERGAAGSGPRRARGRGAAQSASARHKQLSWWILNIAIVLIGVIAISRRMS